MYMNYNTNENQLNVFRFIYLLLSTQFYIFVKAFFAYKVAAYVTTAVATAITTIDATTCQQPTGIT